jgi:hypothetical protein
MQNKTLFMKCSIKILVENGFLHSISEPKAFEPEDNLQATKEIFLTNFPDAIVVCDLENLPN